jgi:hypothetical protein
MLEFSVCTTGPIASLAVLVPVNAPFVETPSDHKV